jgi:hypothetical protein
VSAIFLTEAAFNLQPMNIHVAEIRDFKLDLKVVKDSQS